jgi:hypothetical protein
MTQADSVHSTPPTNTSATRRNILGTIAVAGATALTLPAHAAAPAVDPIYAAIEKPRAAAAAHLLAIEEQNRIQRIHGFGRGDWITEKPCHDENDAFGTLVRALASTRAGLLAKLQYLQDLSRNDEWAWILDEREGTSIALIESFMVSFAALGGCSHERCKIPLQRFPPRLFSKAANIEKRHARRTRGQSGGVKGGVKGRDRH